MGAKAEIRMGRDLEVFPPTVDRALIALRARVWRRSLPCSLFPLRKLIYFDCVTTTQESRCLEGLRINCISQATRIRPSTLVRAIEGPLQQFEPAMRERAQEEEGNWLRDKGTGTRVIERSIR